MKVVNACVLLLLTAAVVSAVAAERDDCLMSSGGDAHAPVEGVRAIMPTKGERATVSFACQAGDVSGVTIRLVPGQAAQARLFVAASPEHIAALAAENGLPPEWCQVESHVLDSGTTAVTLSIATPPTAEVGQVFSDRLRLSPDRDGQPGLEIPVTLEFIEEGPLFRDKFDVDPVIGQFSMIF